MIDEPITEFIKLSEFLNFKVDEELISKVVEDCNFLNLKFLEKNTKFGFREKPSSCKNFFRYGTYGMGRKKLTKNQVILLVNEFKNTMGKYGYLSF